MPILDQIELFLEESYPPEERRGFIFKSRSICNYLERHLGEKAFHTSLGRINIHCTKDPLGVRVTPLKGVPFLEVNIVYDLPSISSLDGHALHQHFTKIIDLGLQSAEQFMAIPHAYCMEVLKKFMQQGCKNEWTQATKNWGNCSLRCNVIAELTTSEFTLTQYIYRDSSMIAVKQIVATKSREMLFIEYLGSLSLDRQKNIVYKRKTKLISKFNIETSSFVECP